MEWHELRRCGTGVGLQSPDLMPVALSQRLLKFVPFGTDCVQSVRARERGSRWTVSLAPSAVTKGPPASGAGLEKATSGVSLGLPARGKSLRRG
jgi:hypothetical protein